MFILVTPLPQCHILDTYLAFVFVTDQSFFFTYLSLIATFHLCHRLVFFYFYIYLLHISNTYLTLIFVTDWFFFITHVFVTSLPRIYLSPTYLYFHLIFTDRSLFGPVIRWLFPLTSPLQGSISYSTPVFKGGGKVNFLLFISLSRQYFPVFKEKFVFSLPPGSNPRHPVGTKNQISAETL